LEILDFFGNILDLDFLGRGSKLKKEFFLGVFGIFLELIFEKEKYIK